MGREGTIPNAEQHFIFCFPGTLYRATRNGSRNNPNRVLFLSKSSTLSQRDTSPHEFLTTSPRKTLLHLIFVSSHRGMNAMRECSSTGSIGVTVSITSRLGCCVKMPLVRSTKFLSFDTKYLVFGWCNNFKTHDEINLDYSSDKYLFVST